MCARTCLFLWLLITPLELLHQLARSLFDWTASLWAGCAGLGPPAMACAVAGLPVAMAEGEWCGGMRYAAVDYSIRCCAAGCRRRRCTLCASWRRRCRAQQQQRRLSCDEQFLQVCSARVDDASSSQLQAFVWASGSAWRCTALLQRCGQQAVW